MLATSVCARCRTRHQERWLTVEEIRKQQRMRRQTVIDAMFAGVLPYEQRGRIRYARVCDVEAWEKSRLAEKPTPKTKRVLLPKELLELL